MNRALGVVLTMLSVATLTLTPARAEASDGGASNDIRVLERQLDEEHATLSTSDCTAACRALGSIQRAAEKICALEPGARCEAARAKAADATRRVREACPDCALASTSREPSPDQRAMTQNESVAASAPPAEQERGGCRSCTTAGSSSTPQDLVLLALSILGGLRALGRRRRPRDDA
jgi:hypothetical protein